MDPSGSAVLTFIDIENRIYREEFTGKKCKKAILLYCFHTAVVLYIFMLYILLDPGILFYRKSKIIFTKNLEDFQNFQKFNDDRILMKTNILNFAHS